MRLLAAAVSAGATSLVIPVAAGVWVFLEGPGVDAGGHADNAPYRAAGMLLMLAPVFLIAAAAYFPIVSWMLRRLGRLSRSTLVLLSAAVAVAFGVVFAVDGLSFGGLPDAAIAFLVASVSSFASVALGSLVWWRLGPVAQQAAEADGRTRWRNDPRC